MDSIKRHIDNGGLTWMQLEQDMTPPYPSATPEKKTDSPLGGVRDWKFDKLQRHRYYPSQKALSGALFTLLS